MSTSMRTAKFQSYTAIVQLVFGGEPYPAFAQLTGKSIRSERVPNIAHTEVIEDAQCLMVRYHQTNVVTYYKLHADNMRVVLATGGYQTATTKARFNQFAPCRVWGDKRLTKPAQRGVVSTGGDSAPVWWVEWRGRDAEVFRGTPTAYVTDMGLPLTHEEVVQRAAGMPKDDAPAETGRAAEEPR